MGLRTHYYGVLKEGCRKVANITTTLNVAMKSFLLRRPTNGPISLDDFPGKSHDAARPSASQRQQQAVDNSQTANKELDLQQQSNADLIADSRQ